MLSGRQGISRSGIKNSQLALLVHSGINDGPGLCAPVFKNKKKSACLTPRFPAYLTSVRVPICLTLATTSLLVISSATVYAQALAPSTLNLTSPEQETKKDIAQAITKEPAQAIAKEPVRATTKKSMRATTKKSMRAITKEPMQALAKEPVQAIAKEPVQAMTKTPIKAITQKAAQAIPKDSARKFAIEPVRPME